jgi:decaprenylphospho-beta-D-ribofuranose 2-oxidase
MVSFSTTKLSGWGRFPVEECRLFRPEKRAELTEILRSKQQPSYISRGLGRSYGDAALNRQAGVISHQRLNRFLAFDERTGVLECEGGVSFAEIIQHLLPRGFFLPVVPGTKFVSVGGAIAADIHGKNHHADGTIARFVLDLQLLTPAGEIVSCSPESNGELFWAAVGGMGLTGVILSARIQLKPVETAYINAVYRRSRDLDQTLSELEALDATHEFSVAWLDGLAHGGALGRGVVICGQYAKATDLPRRSPHPLAPPKNKGGNIPFDLPSFVLNRWTVGAFNSFYYWGHGRRGSRVVDFDSFFFPLDGIGHWNRLYGRRGFVQYQFVLPAEKGREGLVGILNRLARSPLRSYLVVLKRMGEPNHGPLSFPLRGYTLALDFPVTHPLVATLRELNQIVAVCGGRVYLAKDAVLRPETFRAMYPAWKQFHEIKQKVDPQGVLSSSLARRISLVEP